MGTAGPGATPRARPEARPGFTLVEVLVGLLVASLALAAGLGALAAVTDHAGRADATTAETLDGAARRALLVELLEGARLQHGGERFQGLSSELLGTESDELVLPTTGRTGLPLSPAVVRLFVDTDPATEFEGLVAEVYDRVGDAPVYVPIVPEAGRMTVRYGVVGPTGLWGWSGEWTANRIPDAIELVLEPAAGRTLPPLLAYPIRVRLEAVR